MAPFATIYSYPGNWRVQRAQVAASLNGLELAMVPDFQMQVTNKTPEYLAKFPMGQVPTMECSDGINIAEGGAIAWHVAESGPKASQLTGTTPATRASVKEFSFFAETQVAPPLQIVAAMAVMKYAKYEESVYNYMVFSFERVLQRLENALKGGKKFLVGEELTMADIMVAAPLYYGLTFLFDAEMRTKAPETMRWLNGLLEIPEFKGAFGEIKECEKRPEVPTA